jgi:hypothetical protein
MVVSKTIIQVGVLTLLLIAARLLVDVAQSVAFVYPEYDFGQVVLAFIFLIATLLFVFFVAIQQLVRKNVISGLIILSICCIPFIVPFIIDARYWKFLAYKKTYQDALQSGASPIHYRVFNWGNRNLTLGGGFIVEAIVYDESDEIARPPEARSSGWAGRHSLLVPDERWIIDTPTYQGCKKDAQNFGSHFYYVSEICQ